MKVITRTLGIIFFSLIVGTSFGQGQANRSSDPETAAENSLNQMKQIINLNNDKEEKACKEIFLKYAKERQVLRQSMQNGGDRTQARQKMQKMTARQNDELEVILGKERMDIYKKKMQESREQRQTR